MYSNLFNNSFTINYLKITLFYYNSLYNSVYCGA